ncbi:MAG: HAD hydrolase-like protein [Muribaculaceae bacterium]|nr:HAD hydrolase-like protein [Muribaculaceae bacterium]
MRTVYAFDLDDTLYREMDYVHSGYRTVAQAIAQATGADADTIFHTICTNRPLGFEAALMAVKDFPGADTYSVDDLVEIYRAHRPDIALYHGARSTLEALKARGATLALITDGSTRHQRAKIEALGIADLFDSILISQETGGDKTTDIPWQTVETLYGPARRYYIGDNLSKDFRLPNLRGWHTVMLRDRRGLNVFPQRPADWPPQNRPHTTIDNLESLL